MISIVYERTWTNKTHKQQIRSASREVRRLYKSGLTSNEKFKLANKMQLANRIARIKDERDKLRNQNYK